MAQPEVTVGLIAALIALIEVVKFLVRKFSKNGSLSREEHGWLADLHVAHSRTDSNGTPIWYVPRSWHTILVKNQETLQQLVNEQQKANEWLKRIERGLASCDD